MTYNEVQNKVLSFTVQCSVDLLLKIVGSLHFGFEKIDVRMICWLNVIYACVTLKSLRIDNWLKRDWKTLTWSAKLKNKLLGSVTQTLHTVICIKLEHLPSAPQASHSLGKKITLLFLFWDIQDLGLKMSPKSHKCSLLWQFFSLEPTCVQ